MQSRLWARFFVIHDKGEGLNKESMEKRRGTHRLPSVAPGGSQIAGVDTTSPGPGAKRETWDWKGIDSRKFLGCTVETWIILYHLVN
jgi:hypothetical protein